MGEQLLLALIVQFGRSDFSFCRFEVRQCSLQCSFIRYLIDYEKCLTLPDTLAFFNVDRHDPAGNLWYNLHILPPPESGGKFVDRFQ